MIPGLGDRALRQLLNICPEPEKVFEMSHSQLSDLFGKHQSIISAIEQKAMMRQAEDEYAKTQQAGIRILFCTQPEYPQRLNDSDCVDTPLLLYCAGSCDLNAKHTVAFVGSRKSTQYGRAATHQLVEGLKGGQPLIASGLAYGIDTEAHAAALESGLPTAAVLGHGLDIIYPYQNQGLARRIVEKGGALLTEYRIGTRINPAYFPARNRIIAALSDATVVVEAAERSGAIITAGIANSYRREVFAVPGRLDDPTSGGCLNLIAEHKALLARNAGDIFFQMGWKNTFDPARQREEKLSLFAEISDEEKRLVTLLEKERELTLDELSLKSGFPLPKTAAIMMNLELKTIIVALPGRLYKLT